MPHRSKMIFIPVMVVYTFNLSTQEAETGRPLSSEFKVSLVYEESSRTARATERNPASKNKK